MFWGTTLCCLYFPAVSKYVTSPGGCTVSEAVLLLLESFQVEKKKVIQKPKEIKVLQQLAPSPPDLHPFKMASAPRSPGHTKERGCQHCQWDSRRPGTELHSRSCPIHTWEGAQGLCRGADVWLKHFAEGICWSPSPRPGEEAAWIGSGLAPGHRQKGSAQPDLWSDKQIEGGRVISVEAVPMSMPCSFKAAPN